MAAGMALFQRRYVLLCILLIVALILYLRVSVVKKKSPRPNSVPHSVSLLTLNIWFGEYKVKKRMSAIGHTVETLSPAIITFQEVTSRNLGFLQSQPWFLRYHMVPNKRPDNQYFVIILSIFPVVNWRNIPFKNSRMGRNLLLAQLKVEIKPLEQTASGIKDRDVFFTIATSHMESMADTTREREHQLQESLKILSAYHNVCLMGDLNLELKVDGEIDLPTSWFDAWMSRDGNTHTNGYTWDPKNNSNAQVSEPNTTKDRFDRVICKLRNFSVTGMRVIGTKPYNGVFLSDHFGLYTELQVGLGTPGVQALVEQAKFKRPKGWEKYLN